jgi:Flp pilus assembly protein TadG
MSRIRSLLKTLASRLRAEEGVVTVEFALVLPVLLLVVFGIIYFGEFENYSVSETHLAAVAARYAAVNSDPGSGTLQQYILSQAPSPLLSTSTDVPTPAQVYIYYPAGSTGAAGSPVTACVTATVHFIKFLGFANETIAESTTMRLEQTASNWTPNTPPSQCPAA